MMGVASLAKALASWTGSLSVTYGAKTVTVTPRTRESVASLVARLVSDVAGATGLALVVSVSATGVITISSDSTFVLSPTLLCATRTGFTGGPYSGGLTYTAAAPFTGVTVPSKGLRLDEPTSRTRSGSVVGSGASAVGGMPDPVSSTLRLFGTLSEAQALLTTISALASTERVHDLWYEGRLAARLRLDGASVRALTRPRDSTSLGAELAARVTAVRE